MKFRVLRKPAFSQVTLEGAIQPFHTKVVRESIHKLIDNGFSNIILDLSPAVQPLRSVNFTAIMELFIYSRLAGVYRLLFPQEKISFQDWQIQV